MADFGQSNFGPIHFWPKLVVCGLWFGHFGPIHFWSIHFCVVLVLVFWCFGVLLLGVTLRTSRVFFVEFTKKTKTRTILCLPRRRLDIREGHLWLPSD